MNGALIKAIPRYIQVQVSERDDPVPREFVKDGDDRPQSGARGNASVAAGQRGNHLPGTFQWSSPSPVAGNDRCGLPRFMHSENGARHGFRSDGAKPSSGSELESAGLEVASEVAEEPLTKPARTSTRPVLTRIK
jgi:hypothetical protein